MVMVREVVKVRRDKKKALFAIDDAERGIAMIEIGFCFSCVAEATYLCFTYALATLFQFDRIKVCMDYRSMCE